MRRRVAFTKLVGEGAAVVRDVPVPDSRRLVTFRVPPFHSSPAVPEGSIVRIIPGADTPPEWLHEFVEAVRSRKPARVTVLPIPAASNPIYEELFQRTAATRTPRQVVEDMLRGTGERGADEDLWKLCNEIMDEEGL